MITLFMGLLFTFTSLDTAEEAYAAGRYREAFEQFEAALSEPGAPQGTIFYNLGNCAYRMERYAEAALYFHRALLRLPRDERAAFNLHLTEQQLGFWAPAEESFGAATLAMVDGLSPGVLLALASVLQCAGLLGWVLVRRRPGLRNCMIVLVLISLAGAGRLVQTQWFPGPPMGVVLAREVALRPEPHTSLDITRKLKAGETVQVEESSDRWIRITHEKGSGWTERAGVGVVD